MMFACPLLAVTDMERSKKFYMEVLGREIMMDIGANVAFKDGPALQEMESWAGFLLQMDRSKIQTGGNNFELVFEEDDFDSFMKYFEGFADIELVHPVTEYPWGQRVVRFYDPDRHIIEVGHSMRAVIRGFAAQGMTPEQVAERTQHPIEYVRMCLTDAN